MKRTFWRESWVVVGMFCVGSVRADPASTADVDAGEGDPAASVVPTTAAAATKPSETGSSQAATSATDASTTDTSAAREASAAGASPGNDEARAWPEERFGVPVLLLQVRGSAGNGVPIQHALTEPVQVISGDDWTNGGTSNSPTTGSLVFGGLEGAVQWKWSVSRGYAMGFGAGAFWDIGARGLGVHDYYGGAQVTGFWEVNPAWRLNATVEAAAHIFDPFLSDVNGSWSELNRPCDVDYGYCGDYGYVQSTYDETVIDGDVTATLIALGGRLGVLYRSAGSPGFVLGAWLHARADTSQARRDPVVVDVCDTYSGQCIRETREYLVGGLATGVGVSVGVEFGGK